MSTYIATYDIEASRNRRKVARILRHYGVRLQLSVFEIQLDNAECRELMRRVGPHLAPDDEFELLPLDTHPARVRLRWQRDPERFDPVLLL